jgi:hypothetical protein
MPCLLTGHTLLRVNLLQRVKTKRCAGFFNSLILLKKTVIYRRFERLGERSNACLKYL